MNFITALTAAASSPAYKYPPIDGDGWAIAPAVIGGVMAIGAMAVFLYWQETKGTPKGKLLATLISLFAVGAAVAVTSVAVSQTQIDRSYDARYSAIAQWLHDEYDLTVTADDIPDMIGTTSHGMFTKDRTRDTVLTDYNGEFVNVGLVDVSGDRIIAVQYEDDDTDGVPLKPVK